MRRVVLSLESSVYLLRGTGDLLIRDLLSAVFSAAAVWTSLLRLSIAWNTSSCNCPVYAVCSILNWLVELFFSKNFWYFLQSFLETFRCGRLKRVFVLLLDSLVSNWKRQRPSLKETTEVCINALANDQAPWIPHTVAFEAGFISFLSGALAAMLLSYTPWRTRSALL